MYLRTHTDSLVVKIIIDIPLITIIAVIRQQKNHHIDEAGGVVVEPDTDSTTDVGGVVNSKELVGVDFVGVGSELTTSTFFGKAIPDELRVFHDLTPRGREDRIRRRDKSDPPGLRPHRARLHRYFETNDNIRIIQGGKLIMIVRLVTSTSGIRIVNTIRTPYLILVIASSNSGSGVSSIIAQSDILAIRNELS